MESVSIVRAEDVSKAVGDLYREINTHLRPDVLEALNEALAREESESAREILAALLENQDISREDGIPLCQDTGLAVAFVSMGDQVVLEGGTLQEAVDEGVRNAVAEQPLRASTVTDPLERRNAGDNTPAIVHLEHVRGDRLVIRLMAKGGGAENMGRLCMLTPGEGREGVVRVVVETVRDAGANACPPVIVGVGLGGDFETAPLLAKSALFRDMGQRHPEPALAELEAEILAQVNALGIGPQGFGGRTTALAVLIEQAPCHIASLPVAVNLACHSHRHGSVTLKGEQKRLAD